MDKKSNENEPSSPESSENKRGNNSLLIALILAGLVMLLFYNRGEERSLISLSFFQEHLTLFFVGIAYFLGPNRCLHK